MRLTECLERLQESKQWLLHIILYTRLVLYLNTETIYNSSALCLLSPSPCQLWVEFSLTNSRCAPLFAQKSTPGAFYRLLLSFSQLQAAVIVPEFYRVHSTKMSNKKPITIEKQQAKTWLQDKRQVHIIT